LRSQLRTAGVSPAQAHNLRAVGKRLMSPIPASTVIAVSSPTPGRVIKIVTRGSGLARGGELRLDGSDRVGQVIDKRQIVLDDQPSRRAQVGGGPARPVPASPQGAVGTVQAGLGEHGMDAVLRHGAQPHQRDPMPRQGPQRAHLDRRDPGLRQQISAQQLGQRPGVDPIVFQPPEGIRTPNLLIR
jgi:hypothetical protein